MSGLRILIFTIQSVEKPILISNYIGLTLKPFINCSESAYTHGVILLHIPAIVYYINTLDGLGSQIWEGKGLAL